jgi:hypothetical protein
MAISAAALRALPPPQIARGTTLINVTQQLGASIGTALMSMILTNQFNRSENIAAANKLALLQQNTARRGVPVDPAAIPPQTLTPNFAGNVLHDLSHAYTAVFVLAVALVASTIIPAAFLPKKPSQTLTPTGQGVSDKLDGPSSSGTCSTTPPPGSETSAPATTPSGSTPNAKPATTSRN